MENFWQTDAIRLRAIEPDDAAVVYQWNLDSDRARFLDFVWPPSSLASVQSWTAEASKKKLENDAFAWLIETLESVPVGTISTHNCDPHSGVFWYGIDIATEHRRKGYAKAAILQVLRYYFDHLRYQKVTVNIHADNLPSLRLHEALGYQNEGRLRRMAFQNGQFMDVFYYGMTVEEFHAKYPKR